MGKGQWSKTRGKKGGKGQEKSVKGDTRVCQSCGKARLIAANCTTKSRNRSLNDKDEDKGDINDEVHEDEDELHAWCFLEESENEQWQEVISKKSKLKLKKLAHESLLSVENHSCASPRKVIVPKSTWEMQGSQTGSHERNKEIRCSTWRKDQSPWTSAQVHKSEECKRCDPLISMRKVVNAGNVVVLDEKNPPIRNNRDGTVIKRHVNSGVDTMDTWACLDETGPVFSWQGQGVARVSQQTCKTKDEVQQ